jgi:hypothetical protein
MERKRGKRYVICTVAAMRKLRGGYSEFPVTMLVGSARGGNTDSMKRNTGNTGLQPVPPIPQPHYRLPQIQTAAISHDGTRNVKIPTTKPAIQYNLQPIPPTPDPQT